MSMQPAPTFCTCPPLTTGAGSPIARTERWEHQRTCPVRHPLDADQLPIARLARATDSGTELAGPGSETLDEYRRRCIT